MGCGNSTNTAVVEPFRPEEVNEDDTGCKLDGRGDSAVSKGTTDSGVVMENREVAVLPGAVPRKLPPLTGVKESEVDRITQDGLRPKSSEILEELLSQGIIPLGQARERGSGAGEAYSIMLDDREGVKRRPPARLESLKANKTQNLPSREEIEEKIRLAEERRKLREDELKTRLRTKSARVRGPDPTSSTAEDPDAALTTPVEPLHSVTPDPQDPPPHSQMAREEAEGGERVREAAGDGREFRKETGRTDRREWREEGAERGDRGEGAERVSEDSDEEEEEEEELTQLEELENDSSFQQADDKDMLF